MILFKKVSEGFRKIEAREWALLTLETVGVLAGILIAFELQEWGERRSQAARHHELMERLFEESRQDVSATRDLRDMMRQILKAEVEFATALSNGECPPAPMWRAADTLGMLPAFNAPRSVYQELMGAGGLASIKDPKVRAAIADFNTAFDWSQKQNDYFRSFTPSNQVISDSDPRYSVRYDPKADDPSVSSFDRAALCRDHEFRNRIATSTRNHFTILGFHEQVTDAAIVMCAILGDSLAQRCEPDSGDPFSVDDLKLVRNAVKFARDPDRGPSARSAK